MKLFRYVHLFITGFGLCLALGALSANAYAVQLVQGWNLLGNSLNQTFSVATLFGDTNVVNTVWKWDTTNSGWQFYTPSMTSIELQTYATSRGYGVLTQIQPDDGYWVNAKVAASITPSSTDSIASYMSAANIVEQALSANDRPANLCTGGGDVYAYITWKEGHVQHFLNTVIANIQIVRNTSPIDKTAVASLLSTYQAQDVAWSGDATFKKICANIVMSLFLTQSGYTTIVNFAYTNAIAQLNAM